MVSFGTAKERFGISKNSPKFEDALRVWARNDTVTSPL
jgi:hypothetical protein